MRKGIIKSVVIGMTILSALGMTATPVFAATAPVSLSSVPNGSVIFNNTNDIDIGSTCTLDYANNLANQSIIQSSVVNSKSIWIKEFDGTFVDNNTGKSVPSSTLPMYEEYFNPVYPNI